MNISHCTNNVSSRYPVFFEYEPSRIRSDPERNQARYQRACTTNPTGTQPSTKKASTGARRLPLP
eukprot:10124501-Alexandrium_andersonii.AAC.1